MVHIIRGPARLSDTASSDLAELASPMRRLISVFKKTPREHDDAGFIHLAPENNKAQPKRKQIFTNETTRVLHEFPVPGKIKILPDPPIKTGGFCLVYKGAFTPKGTKKEEIVAMKCLTAGESPDTDRKVFRRETASWRKFQHPHILPFYGTFVRNDVIYMISPWAENGTLCSYLQRKPGVDRQVLLVQIAKALGYIHEECNVVHGDVKANNVLIDHSGNALLTDFGLVTHLEAFLPGVTATASTHRTAMTLPYSAPEILIEDSKIPDSGPPIRAVKSRATDVYAFGMVILEVYTMERPWKGYHPDGVFYQVMLGRLPPKPEGDAITRGFTPFLWKLVELCSKSDSSKRPSMSDLVVSMEASTIPPGAADLSGEVSELHPLNPENDALRVGKRRHRGVDEKVLLKKPTETQMLHGKKIFQRELQKLALVQHPNILQVYGTAGIGPELFIITAWMEPMDIISYISKTHNPQANRFKLLHQVSDALSFLHSGPVAEFGPMVHGSLHPECIWITGSGDVKLTDFGLSSFSDIRFTGLGASTSADIRVMDVGRSNVLQDFGCSSKTDSQIPETTVRFLPPEFFLDPEHHATKQGDVYSFAMVMYQVFTGNVPFADILDSFAVILTSVIKNKSPEIPQTGADDSTWALIKECWSPMPENRPHMVEVRDRLAPLVS